jgi:HEAT repeat protein
MTDAIGRYRELSEARARGKETEFLRRCLEDENPLVVTSAMGLFRLRGEPAAMESMVPLAHHPEVQVRYDLAESIPYMGGAAAGAAGIELLEDSDSNVQLLAAYGLGRMHHEPAAPALASALEDPTREIMVRASCLEALDKMASTLLIPALERAIEAGPDSTTVAGFRIHLARLRKAAASGSPR